MHNQWYAYMRQFTFFLTTERLAGVRWNRPIYSFFWIRVCYLHLTPSFLKQSDDAEAGWRWAGQKVKNLLYLQPAGNKWVTASCWYCVDMLKVVYIMDHEVVPCRMAFFHGHTSWSFFHGQIYENCKMLKFLGPLLGVNKMWIMRSPHAPNNGWGWFLKYMSRKGSFGYLRFYLKKGRKRQNYFNGISLPYSPNLCSMRNSFASLTAKSVGPWQWIS